jgi:AraC-like DNA-binding protein/TolB-like protein
MNGIGSYSGEFQKKLTDITEANLKNEQFGVSELARLMGMSRSNLHKKVKSTLKISISQFICQVRLKHAMEILRKTSSTVSEVAYEVGFGSVTYFIKSFHDYYGYPPGKVSGRTEQDHHDDETKAGKTQINKKRLISAAAAMLFMILLIFAAATSNLRLFQNSTKITTPKNIAVLPLQFEGSDSMKMVAVGLRESFLNSLMELEKLSVRSETSVEQYRESTKSLKEIAKELKVEYVIEMNCSQRGNNTRLQVNLADAVKDKYLWRDSYPVDIEEESFLDLHSRIAREIIINTQTDISFREKEILEERLSDNPAALNYYLQAMNHMALKWQIETFQYRDENIKEIINAKEKFKKAIMLDSSFTAAYVRLGNLYIDAMPYQTYDPNLKLAYLDSGLFLAKKALLHYENLPKDKNFNWAMILISTYHYHNGDLVKSKEIYEQAQKNRVPRNKGYYEGTTFRNSDYDQYSECIESFYNFSEIIQENEIIRPILYEKFCNSLFYTNFAEVAEKYELKCLNITNDSLNYYIRLSFGNLCIGNYTSCIDYANKFLEQDSSSVYLLYWLMHSYIILNQHEQASIYAAALGKSGQNDVPEVMGFILQKKGNEQEATEYFSKAVEKYLGQINSHTLDAAKYQSHLSLAWTYSAMGDKEEALKYLEEVINRPTIPYWMIIWMKDWPLFDNIRNEPEFKAIQKELTKKYQKEHDRVAKLLREKGEIPPV